MKMLGRVIVMFLLTTTLFLLNGCGPEDPETPVTDPGNFVGFELPNEATRHIGIDRITDIKFLKEPSWIIASSRFSIQIYENAKLIGQLTGHPGDVETIALSPDGNTLVAGCADGTIRFWQVDSIKEKMVEDKFSVFTERNEVHTDIQGSTEEGINAVALSRDGDFLASGSKFIKLWDNKTKKEIKSFGDNFLYTTALAFSEHENKLVSGSRENVIQVWEINKGNPLSILNEKNKSAGEITALTFSPAENNINIFASSGTDGKILLWDITKEDKLLEVNKEEDPAENNKEEDPAENNKEEDPAENNKNIVYTVTFDRSGKRLAAGGEDKVVRVWAIDVDREPSAELLYSFEGHQYPITVVVFSEAGDVLASGDSGGTIFLWNIP